MRRLFAGCILGCLLGAAPAQAGVEPTKVRVRVTNFTVPPSTGPVGNIIVKNDLDEACEVSVNMRLPEGWKYRLSESGFVQMEVSETVHIPFNIDKAVDVGENRYAVAVDVVDREGRVTVHKQEIVCASAPYFKPKIDGNLAEWVDSIPVTFGEGAKTVIRTYWSREFFCLAVEVPEERLSGYRKDPEAGSVDAVQFAISAKGAVTPDKANDKAQRYEFLIADVSGLFARDKCFLLMTPENTVGVSPEMRTLDGLECEGAEVVVKRKGGVTYYECAVPFAKMKDIRPDVGREICFSVLVHDGDGGPIRDWGQAAGLWPEQRNKYAWSSWQGVKWGTVPCFDNKIEWGLCSSKY